MEHSRPEPVRVVIGESCLGKQRKVEVFCALVQQMSYTLDDSLTRGIIEEPRETVRWSAKVSPSWFAENPPRSALRQRFLFSNTGCRRCSAAAAQCERFFAWFPRHARPHDIFRAEIGCR